MENCVAGVFTIPRVPEILAYKDDRVGAHAASQVQSGCCHRTPSLEGALAKSEFCKEWIGKQAQPKKETPRSRLKRRLMDRLFRDEIGGVRHRADDMPRIQFARVRYDNRVRRDSGSKQWPQGRINRQNDASVFEPTQIANV